MDEILARLERIESRLDTLEGRGARPPPTIPSPSIVPPPTAGGEDLETALGTRWLPRAGALAVVAAIAYLVSLGLQRGLVTPAMVAAGIAAACAATALVGASLRNEREAFGNVLVGLGSGGLYVDAVGSHLYHELLNGDATVILCLSIGLATLGFGAMRGLPSFLGIGLFGGLIAALMPLSKGEVAVASSLSLLVTAPAFVVAALRRWSMVVAGTWLASFLAGLAILLTPGWAGVRLIPIDAGLLMALAAWTWSAEPLPTGDPQGTFPFLAAVTFGAAVLAVNPDGKGMAQAATLGFAATAITPLFPLRSSGARTRAAGLFLSLAIAPLGLRPEFAAVALAGLVLLESTTLFVILHRSELETSARSRISGTFARPLMGIQAVLAIGCYAYGVVSSGPPAFEPELILLLAVAALAAATALDFPEARVVAGVVAWGLATRLGVISLGLPLNAAITVAWIAVLAGLLVVGFARRRAELRQLGLLVAAVTVGKVALVDLAGVDAASKAVVLLGLGVVLLAGGYAYVRSNR